MGLSVDVGALAYFLAHDPEGAAYTRARIADLNAALKAHGLPEHHEPEAFAAPPLHDSEACMGYPCSFLHCLRRAYAHFREGRPVPDDDEARAEHDRVVDDATSKLDSHLLCHSDADGFYVPIDFPDPIAVDGGALGSSYALLRELVDVAPHIGVTLQEGSPTPACEADLVAIEDSGPFWRERIVWYSLFVAATASVKHRTLIVFG